MDAFALFGFHATVGLKPNLAERNSKHMKCRDTSQVTQKKGNVRLIRQNAVIFPDRAWGRGVMSALLDLHFPNGFISAEDVVISTRPIYASFIRTLFNVGPKTWLGGLALALHMQHSHCSGHRTALCNYAISPLPCCVNLRWRRKSADYTLQTFSLVLQRTLRGWRAESRVRLLWLERRLLSFERYGRYVLCCVSTDGEPLTFWWVITSSHLTASLSFVYLWWSALSSWLNVCTLCVICYFSRSYLFWALLLFHTVSYNNVNNFPPEPLNYPLEAALLPCGGIHNKMLEMQKRSHRHKDTCLEPALNTIEWIQSHRLTRAPIKTPHIKKRADCKHFGLGKEMW